MSEKNPFEQSQILKTGQQDTPEIEHSTDHTDEKDPRIKSEKIRYSNADSLYK
ncbi:hypothetical protein [Cohnella sp.]|uniref:hypothetical protein n=1 Tax=Cohnella sp. TaxID=1883426 RepID=UPI00356B5ED1